MTKKKSLNNILDLNYRILEKILIIGEKIAYLISGFELIIFFILIFSYIILIAKTTKKYLKT